MTAIDDAEPGRMATSDVTILVQRNANPPKFSESSYRVTVSAKATLGEPVIRVNATDGDDVGHISSSSRTLVKVYHILFSNLLIGDSKVLLLSCHSATISLWLDVYCYY